MQSTDDTDVWANCNDLSDQATSHGSRHMPQQPAQQLHLTYYTVWFDCSIKRKCLCDLRSSFSGPSPYLLIFVPPLRCLVEYILISVAHLPIFIFLCPSPSSSGFGGCVDLIVDGVSLLNKIGLSPTDQPLHHDYIENAEQLTQSFAYFFSPGAAAE